MADIVPPVIGVDELLALRADRADRHDRNELPPPLVVADVRWYLGGQRDGRTGYQAFVDGHLPDAVWVDLDRHLAAHDAPTTEGRHPLPAPARFAAAMAGYGIGRPEPCTVVAYDDQGGMSAARLVVMLRMLDVSATLLDGGLQAWIAAGQPLTAGEAVTSQLAHFQPSPWPTPMLATADDVRNAPHDTVLLDGRSPERFRGDGAAAGLDPRPGHVPGARNAPWSAVLRTDHDDLPRLKSPRELAEHYRTLGVAATDDGPDVVAYCGSGISACMNVLAMQHAGFRAPRLFVASWSGWASDSNNPAELGDPTA